jgi:hypothetical protein
MDLTIDEYWDYMEHLLIEIVADSWLTISTIDAWSVIE